MPIVGLRDYALALRAALQDSLERLRSGSPQARKDAVPFAQYFLMCADSFRSGIAPNPAWSGDFVVLLFRDGWGWDDPLAARFHELRAYCMAGPPSAEECAASAAPLERDRELAALADALQKQLR